MSEGRAIRARLGRRSTVRTMRRASSVPLRRLATTRGHLMTRSIQRRMVLV
jgi:hypothetical protein